MALGRVAGLGVPRVGQPSVAVGADQELPDPFLQLRSNRTHRAMLPRKAADACPMVAGFRSGWRYSHERAARGTERR